MHIKQMQLMIVRYDPRPNWHVVVDRFVDVLTHVPELKMKKVGMQVMAATADSTD